MSDERSNERRWVVVAEDGRYVTLGRASDPSEEEILGAEKSLVAQGMSGWLAVMQGSPHVGATPRLMEVRVLGKPKAAFAAASDACVAAILERRREVRG
ncbi:hypothetical protein [Roseomonas populi]|uniref:Type II toxin-antitoxin system HicB family antitoxin n=1 Tax=Roseomonas populi TaxID=3121582 RepID=A0ABT1X4W1_9PROT|nr:hypothetical protein [Roseomonas pecuniae]MCR0983145.1 hypothetical protein [Roseomonas pecuniae]